MITNEPQRIGVLGTGKQAVEHRIPSLMVLADEGVELVAVAGRDLGLAQSVLERLSAHDACAGLRDQGYPIPDGIAERTAAAHAYGSLAEMIADERLDGVVTAVAHVAHAAVAIEAMEAQLHVLGEKPMATNLDDAERMVEVARRHKRILAIGYQWPYSVAWPREAMDRGEIGALRGARVRWSREDGIPSEAHFWDDAQSGGVALDLVGHQVALLAALIDGEPTSVSARSRRDRGVASYGNDFEAEDTIEAEIAFAGGVRAKLEASWAAGLPPDEELRLTIYGARGWLDAPLIPQKRLGYKPDPNAFRPILRREGHEPLLLGPPPPTYAQCIVAQARNWVRACRRIEPLRFTAQDALAVERVVRATLESARLGGDRVSVQGCREPG